MQDLFIVNVLQAQRQLHKPVQDLSLREKLATLLSFLDSTLEVRSLAVIHDHAHVLLFDEAIVIAYHICMI